MTDSPQTARHPESGFWTRRHMVYALAVVVVVLLAFWSRRAFGQLSTMQALEQLDASPSVQSLVTLAKKASVPLGLIGAAIVQGLRVWWGSVKEKLTKTWSKLDTIISEFAGLQDSVKELREELKAVKKSGDIRHGELQELRGQVKAVVNFLHNEQPTVRPAETQEVNAPTAIRRHTGE